MSLSLIFSLLFTVHPGDTLTSPWPSQHVEKKSGLSNSAITSVFMDAYDQIWLGTWDGLNRYDGSAITVYKPNPFINGTISNNIVRSLLEDGYGNLWVVTHQGINQYHRDTDTFTSYLDVLNDVPLLEYNIRACVGYDSAIWVSLIGKGIMKYSAKRDEFVPLTFSGVDPGWFKSVIDLTAYRGLIYFLGNDLSLVATANNQVLVNKKISVPSAITYHRFVSFSGKHFLVIATSKGELFFYDLDAMEGEPQRFTLGKMTVSSISESMDKKSLWVGSDLGSIYKISLTNNLVEVRSMNPYFPIFSKSKIKILDITETSMNLVWVATDGDGVYKFMTSPKAFFSISEGDPKKGDLSHKIVRAIYEDPTGKVYIGTRGGGLNIKSPASSSMQVINTKSQLSNDAVLALNKDRQGNLWVGVDGEGIDMIESPSNKILHFPRDLENNPNLKFGSVYSICIDAFNDIWLGTSGYGVLHFSIKKLPNGKYQLHKYEQLQHSGKANESNIKSNVVYTIVEEKPNILWFGTRGAGIYRYNAITKKLEHHIDADINKKNSLTNSDVLSLYIDKQEQLWIGTSGGLNRLFLQTKPYRIDRYTQQEGLLNNTIHAIQEDDQNNLWVSTNDGLLMLNRESTNFKKFDNNDGLQNVEFTDGASFRSKISPTLYFGGVTGLDVVDPAKVMNTKYFPRLAFTKFQIRNVPILPGDETKILTNYIDQSAAISLTYDQNFFSFEFTTLDYWNKQKTRFAYLLQNFDTDWNYINQQQSVTFTNVPSGEYILKIKYTNANGDWCPQPRSIAISIAPPFWKSTWAYTIYVLIAIAAQVLIVVFLRWRMKRKRTLAITKFKAEQAKEMNDYKLQFFTNIAHEFRTPLTLILAPISSLLKSKRDESEAKQLRTVYNNSLRLQKLVDELMEFRKIESGKERLHISCFDLIEFTDDIIQSFQPFVQERELQLEFYPEQESFQVHLDKRKIEKILINLISNAIKYSLPGGTVGVFLKKRDQQAIFQIKDEGIGIATENINEIFESFYQNPSLAVGRGSVAKSTGIGLSLTKSLVQIHKGSISVSSYLGKGSSFTIILPVNKEAYTDIAVFDRLLLPSNLQDEVSFEFATELSSQRDPSQQAAAQRKKYSVLLVDDHVNITSLLENLLSDKYNIYKATNGKLALLTLEEEKIDLVISDILMPEMNGLELCKQIKENIHTSHIPVILLTAKGEIENRIEGLQVGADSYIPKPFHPEHITVRVEKLLERLELIRTKFSNAESVELQQAATGISERDDQLFSKIIRCIQENLSNTEFDADMISNDVGMSKPSLYKKIKAITGQTPHGLIKQYRIRKAAELLRNSGMSVSEIIFETGFKSRSYFYKCFNEAYHCHPKDFNGVQVKEKNSENA